MKNRLPHLSVTTFTGSAVVIGFLLGKDLSIDEQNAISEWLILVGQIIQTNTSWMQVLNDSKTKQEQTEEERMQMIKDCVEKMQQKLNNLSDFQ